MDREQQSEKAKTFHFLQRVQITNPSRVYFLANKADVSLYGMTAVVVDETSPDAGIVIALDGTEVPDGMPRVLRLNQAYLDPIGDAPPNRDRTARGDHAAISALTDADINSRVSARVHNAQQELAREIKRELALAMLDARNKSCDDSDYLAAIRRIIQMLGGDPLESEDAAIFSARIFGGYISPEPEGAFVVHLAIHSVEERLVSLMRDGGEFDFVVRKRGGRR